MTRDDERRLALTELMALPDPPELAGRRWHRVTRQRSFYADVDRMRRDLATAYVAWRNQTVGADVSRVMWTRREDGRKLKRLVRRA